MAPGTVKRAITSLLKFVDIFGAVMDPFNRQGKAIPNTDFEDWMALFRDKLDEKTYNLIFTNVNSKRVHFTSAAKVVDPRTSQHDVCEGTVLRRETLLIYQFDLLNDASPLPPRSRKERRVAVLSDEGGETK